MQRALSHWSIANPGSRDDLGNCIWAQLLLHAGMAARWAGLYLLPDHRSGQCEILVLDVDTSAIVLQSRIFGHRRRSIDLNSKPHGSNIRAIRQDGVLTPVMDSQAPRSARFDTYIGVHAQ